MIRSNFGASFAAAFVFGCSFFVACGSSDRGGFEEDPSQPRLSDADSGAATTQDSGPTNECASRTLEAEPLSLSMLVVQDRSGSMKGASWAAATSAMIAFADGASAVGTQLGLSVFPPDPPNIAGCDAKLFEPIVPIGALPQNSTIIKNALLSRYPDGLTPMGQAVVAAHKAMKEHVAANSNVEGVLLLVTDGLPTGCGSSPAEVEFAVNAAWAEKPPIRTFVVGMDGADFTTLDKLAFAGHGTSKAFNATSANGDVQAAIMDALEAARESVVGCEFTLPRPSTGVLDLDTVEVQLTTSANGSQTFRKVADVDACGVSAGGFYYDDPANPQRIMLCPTSCDAVRSAQSDAKVDVHLGCIRGVN